MSLQKAANNGELTPEMKAVFDRAEAVAKGLDPTEEITMPASATDAETDQAAFEKAVSGLPLEVRKGLIATQRRAAEAESLAKTLLDDREDQRFEAIAKELLHLPGVDAFSEEQSFAKALRTVNDAVEPETFSGLLSVLKAADSALAQSGLFKEVGTSGGGAGGASSAGASIEGFAKALRDADPELTVPDSVAQAAMEHPELYSQHRVETLRANQEV